MTVTLAPAAMRDLEEIGDYIYADSPSSALRFMVQLRQRCNRLGNAPRGGVLRPDLKPGLRSASYRRYIIYYSVRDNDVRVERILHGARDIIAIFGDDHS